MTDRVLALNAGRQRGMNPRSDFPQTEVVGVDEVSNLKLKNLSFEVPSSAAVLIKFLYMWGTWSNMPAQVLQSGASE